MGLLVLNGHTDEVYSVSWSPDGKWLVSGSFDRTVRSLASLSLPLGLPRLGSMLWGNRVSEQSRDVVEAQYSIALHGVCACMCQLARFM
jgi:WD40 repeat protein